MGRKDYIEIKTRNQRLLSEEIEQKKTVLTAFPTEAAIYFTKKCNLHCIKCFRRFPIIMERQHEMEQDLFESIADQLFPTLVKAETTLIGEPLMCPYWDRVVELFKRYGVMMNITTNGTLLTAKVVEGLDGATDWLKVSIDACERETYESIHVGADFETTVRNLKHFGRMKKQMNPEPWFRLGIVLMKRNIESLPRYIAFAKEVGADQVETLGFVSYHPTHRSEELFDIPKKANAAIDAAIRKADELNIDLELSFRYVPDPDGGPPPMQEEGEQLERGKHRTVEGDVCHYLFHRPYIFGNGRVESCGNCETRAMGELKERSFREIWNGPVYQDMRRTFYSDRDELYGICQRCICMNTTYNPSTYRKDFGVEPEKELEGVWAALNRKIPPGIRKRIPRELKRSIKRLLLR